MGNPIVEHNPSLYDRHSVSVVSGLIHEAKPDLPLKGKVDSLSPHLSLLQKRKILALPIPAPETAYAVSYLYGRKRI